MRQVGDFLVCRKWPGTVGGTMKPSRMLPRRFFLQSLVLAGSGRLAWGAAALPRLPTVDEETQLAAKNAALGMLFNGRTPADFAAWRKAFAAALNQRLGPHQPPPRWSPSQLARTEFSDHTRTEWLLSAPGVPSLPLYVLNPSVARHGPGPYPIIVALHGHGEFGHDAVAGVDDTPERVEEIKKLNYDYGRQLVREGYLVIVPCLTPFGRRLDRSYVTNRRNDPCATAFVRLMLLGRTLMGENVRDVRWALDYAQTRPDARPDRAACVGLSYGGRMTMLAAALDERFQVAVISGALNMMQERVQVSYSCGGQVVPGLLEIGDTPEIGSLIAPRPCIWEVGSKDGLIKPEWVKVAKERLGRAYAAAGQPGNLQYRHFEGGHSWDGTTAVPLLASVLKRA